MLYPPEIYNYLWRLINVDVKNEGEELRLIILLKKVPSA
jgi:hypothetical protein